MDIPNLVDIKIYGFGCLHCVTWGFYVIFIHFLKRKIVIYWFVRINSLQLCVFFLIFVHNLTLTYALGQIFARFNYIKLTIQEERTILLIKLVLCV